MHALRDKIEGVARELARFGAIRDPAHGQLAETRLAVAVGWRGATALLYKQEEVAIASEVRQFAKGLPPVLTDRERIATGLVRDVRGSQIRANTRRRGGTRTAAGKDTVSFRAQVF